MTDHETNETTVEVPVTKQRPESGGFEEVLFYERKPAGFWVRFWAYLIDLLVIAGLTAILVKPIFALTGIETTSIPWYAPYAIVSAILFYGYFVLMTKFFCQTVGKMVMGIRVVSLKSDSISWMTLLFREWIGRFLSVTILPLYWIVGFTPLKQGVHDYIADTTVVHEESFRKNRLMKKKHIEGSGLHDTQAF
ncbi:MULTISPECIES: RDD family protein [Planococcus]|uniref:RDD family protein n=2 Tax=Planococcus TaxID=1372 RepID=A0ABM5WXN6_9BACL|nr:MULTISPECIES: RDD family protein [Planococcus]ALS79091.1 RDD family protein [Planococcus kocurii]AQU78951.1 RDD family protein [Planococcus faecalis]MDJ0330889.1 RDD family protein [Planococcus sp. S3-L1]